MGAAPKTFLKALEKAKGVGGHIRLRAVLRGGRYDLENEWDFWIFNEPMDCNTSAVRVVKEITAQNVEDMKNGERILLLGSGPFPGLPITFQITPGGRVNGNCGTVIYDHPLTRAFPQDGFCDWQFMPMFRDGGAVVFNDLDIPFRPIIEIVSTYKMIKKQAGIFELKIGSGGMLVCTFQVLNRDPAAKALYASMVRYLSSEAFQPEMEVTAEKMLEIMDTNKDMEVDFTTDECYDTGGHIEV